MRKIEVRAREVRSEVTAGREGEGKSGVRGRRLNRFVQRMGRLANEARREQKVADCVEARNYQKHQVSLWLSLSVWKGASPLDSISVGLVAYASAIPDHDDSE